MEGVRYGFQPMRVDQGASGKVLVGCSGELLRIDADGSPLHQPVVPFPSNVSGGAVIGESWVGTWVDQELREARMAALQLDGDWIDGGAREQLREASGSNLLMPASSIWSRRLDAEPMALTRTSAGVVFATLNRGVYLIDERATELWRSPYPEWSGLTKYRHSDSIVSCTEHEGKIGLWSRSGSVTLLDAQDGSFVSSHAIELMSPLAGAEYSEDGGWLLMQESGGVGILDNLQHSPRMLNTPGPVFDANYSKGRWRWTGWRHDGVSLDGKCEIEIRRDIGIGLVGYNVVTNDGRWDEFRAKLL